MKARIFPAIILAFIFLLVAATANNDEVILNFYWHPGQTLTYKITLDAEAKSEGMKMLQMKLMSDVQLLVNNVDGNGIAEVTLKQKDMRMYMNIFGQDLNVHVTKDNITASINGEELSWSDYQQLKRDIAPAQKLMNSDVKFLIDKGGHVLKVFGMEGLDEQMRREMSFALLEDLEIPTHPLKVGDEFVQRRNFTSALPQDVVSMLKTVDDCDIEVKSFLEAVETNQEGGKLAILRGEVKKTFTDFPLDEKGNCCDLTFDFDYTSWFDITRGYIKREIGKGRAVIEIEWESPIIIHQTMEMLLME
jgi:hypothetical protein